MAQWRGACSPHPPLAWSDSASRSHARLALCSLCIVLTQPHLDLGLSAANRGLHRQPLPTELTKAQQHEEPQRSEHAQPAAAATPPQPRVSRSRPPYVAAAASARVQQL